MNTSLIRFTSTGNWANTATEILNGAKLVGVSELPLQESTFGALHEKDELMTTEALVHFLTNRERCSACGRQKLNFPR